MPRAATRIGLVFGHGLGFYRDILRGIKSFAESRPHWVFTPIAPEPETLGTLRPLDFDGLIAQVTDREMARTLIAWRRPLVNVSGVLPDLPVSRVGVDHVEVGRLAAGHLLDRGLRHFGFLGYHGHAFSVGREAGFRGAVEAAGCPLATLLRRDAIRWETSGLWLWDREIPRWLAALPKPAGVFASHDLQGVQVSEACRRSGLRVPDDVAIVGVDDDDLLCEMARPPLSSVALPCGRIGSEAARLLDRLLAGPRRQRPPTAVVLAPTRVVTRASTDVLAIDDPDVVAAVRFIRARADEPIQVGDVARAATVSRRTLERRFRDAMGRSLWEEIRRTHMERARALLSGTDMTIGQVAAHAGFGESKQLSVVFREETGLTPTEFRRRCRSDP